MKALLTPDGRITLRQKIIKTDLENLKIFLWAIVKTYEMQNHAKMSPYID